MSELSEMGGRKNEALLGTFCFLLLTPSLMKINLNITELLIYPTRSWLRQEGKLSKERKCSLRRPSMWTMPAGSVQLVQDLDRSNGGIF